MKTINKTKAQAFRLLSGKIGVWMTLNINNDLWQAVYIAYGNAFLYQHFLGDIPQIKWVLQNDLFFNWWRYRFDMADAHWLKTEKNKTYNSWIDSKYKMLEDPNLHLQLHHFLNAKIK